MVKKPSPPHRTGVLLTIQVPKDIKAALSAAADHEDRTMTAIVIRLVREHLIPTLPPGSSANPAPRSPSVRARRKPV
jgi:hypothetical protein